MVYHNIFLDGQKIRSKRILLNMSQAELAQGITTQATISFMENVNRIPNIATLLEILDRLNLDLSSIIAEKSCEEEMQSLFTNIIGYEGRYSSIAYKFEKQRMKNTQVTGIYKYVVNALDYFYADKPNYSRAGENLELVVTDPQFKSIRKINKYVIYQYLALSKNRLGFVQVARNYFNQMMSHEPNIDVLDDEQFRCVLNVRSNYIKFLIEKNDYSLSEHYIKESLALCKQKFTIYLVPDFYRQLADIQNHKGLSALYQEYLSRADKIDSLLTL